MARSGRWLSPMPCPPPLRAPAPLCSICPCFFLPQELYLAFREELRATPVWVEGAGHNDVESLLYPEGRFWDIMNKFLVEHCSCTPVPRGNTRHSHTFRHLRFSV